MTTLGDNGQPISTKNSPSENINWKKIVSDLVNLTLDKQAFKWMKEGYLENDAEFGTAIAVLTKQFNSKSVKNAIDALKQ